MRVISAYLLVRLAVLCRATSGRTVPGVQPFPSLQAVLGGNESPSAEDIKGILDSGVSFIFTLLSCVQHLVLPC